VIKGATYGNSSYFYFLEQIGKTLGKTPAQLIGESLDGISCNSTFPTTNKCKGNTKNLPEIQKKEVIMQDYVKLREHRASVPSASDVPFFFLNIDIFAK